MRFAHDREIMLLLGALVAVRILNVYVSDAGNDANAGTSQAPYRSLAPLRAKLRALLPDRPTVTVRLLGTIRLGETETFGTEANNIRFVGPATISGGVEIRGWRATSFNGHSAWAAAAPFDFHELFVDGVRAPRPQLPKAGFDAFTGYATPQANDAYNEGQTAMRFRAGDLRADWRNLGDVELVAHQFWVTSRLPIAGIDGDVVRFTKKSVFRLRDDYTASLAPFVVENVAEAMDTPGQWYLDRPSHTVYYLPKPGENRKKFVAVAPRLATLIRMQGCDRVSFENITFRDTEYDLPPDSAGDVQAAFSVPGAFQIVDSNRVQLKNCRIEHTGGVGVEILGSSKNSRVEHCVLRDLGAGGVKIGSGPMGSVLSDNVIEHGGRVFASACGILVQLSGDNRIVHNRIQDMFYTGISVGWDWGFRDTDAKNNLIADNDISDIGQEQLSDMGGIYVLGKQPGSRIERNRIRHVSARGYGGWGIYLDEGSTGWTVENNVVLDTKTGGFHIHYGGNNVVRNNVFAYARKEGQLIRSRDDKQGPIRFERNLVVARPGQAPLVVPSWLKRDVVMTGNLYALPKTDLPFGDDGTGRFIETTLTADGLPVRGSDAYRMGFHPIDLSQIGPRGK